MAKHITEEKYDTIIDFRDQLAKLTAERLSVPLREVNRALNSESYQAYIIDAGVTSLV